MDVYDRPRRGDIVAALDIGSSKICCLVVEMQGAGSELSALVPPKVVSLGYHRSGGIRGGMVFDPAAAERAIRAAVDRAEKQAGHAIDKVHISLNTGRLRSESFGKMLELGGGKVRGGHVDDLKRQGWEHVAATEDALLHALSTGFALDEGPASEDPVGYSGKRLFADFCAVTADLEPVRRLLGCVEDGYLTPVSVVAAPYASGLATLRPQEAREGALVVDLGGGTSSLAVFVRGQMIFADSLSKGGIQISAALEKRFAISWREAELLKLAVGRGGSGTEANPQAREIVDAQYAGIFLHLKQRLAENCHALNAVRYVVLTGGGALYEAAPRLAADIFGRPSRAAAPLHATGLPPQLASAAFAALWGVVAYLDRKPSELAARFAGERAGSFGRIGHWLRRIGDPLSKKLPNDKKLEFGRIVHRP